MTAALSIAGGTVGHGGRMMPQATSAGVIAAARARWERWWSGGDDAAISYIIHPRPGFTFAPVARPWMAPAITGAWSNWQHELVLGQALERVARDGDWTPVEDAIDLLVHYHADTTYAGGGYPFYFPGFGAGFLAACISGQSHFKDTTIWFETGRQWSLAEIAALRWHDLTPWCNLCLESLRRVVARVQPHAVIAMPEIGLPLDVLSALHGNDALCMALIDDPEAVEAAEAALWDLHQRLTAACAAIIAPGNHGCSTVAMRFLSAGGCDLGSCDFAAMISPRQFARFHLPQLRDQCAAAPGRVIFHLDGPGLVPHLEHILAVPGLAGIQWVQGAGKPSSLDPCWFPLYRRIIDAGKKVQLCHADDPEGLAALFRALPRRHFFVPVSVRCAAEAEVFERVCQG
jgi:hypothetical protein